jgi:hypothetical protein
MPLLRNTKTNELELVADSQVRAAIDSGSHAIAEEAPLQVEALGARGGVTDPEQLGELSRGTDPAAIVTDADRAAQEQQAYEAQLYGGAGETLAAGITGALDMATLGGFSALERATDEDDNLARSTRQHKTAHTVGQVAGAIGMGRAPILPGGAVTRGARALAPGAEVGALGQAAIRGGVAVGEGAVLGAGVGVAQTAIEDEPVTVERIMGNIKTNALLGGFVGGGVVGGASLVGSGIRGAKQLANRMAKRAPLPDDLANMDLPALRRARETHVEQLQAEAIPQRAAVADEIAAFRAEGKAAKPWIAVEGFKKAAKAKKPRGKKAAAEAAPAPAEDVDPLGFDDPFRYLPIGRKSSEEVFAPLSSKATPEQRQAVDIYSTTDFQQINGYLRGKTAGTPLQKEHSWYSPDKLLDETNPRGPMALRTAVRHIDELMETSQAPTDMMVFRGASGEHLPKKWTVGDVYDDPAYPSVTFESKVAEQFHYGKGEGGVGKTLMEIEVPKGTPMVHVSQIAGGAEAEALLPRGTRFRVQNVKTEGNVRVVRVRAEPPARPPPTVPGAAAQALDVPPELSREFREIAKLTLEADRALDRLLRNPKRLAERPWLAEGPLQQAEHALERLQTVAPELRARMAMDLGSSGQREAALDAVDGFLERNRTLQARLKVLTPEGQGGTWKPASQRLEAILEAEDSLKGLPKTSLAQEAATGYAMGAMAGLMPGGPMGAAIAYAAPKVARRLTDLVFGRMRRAAAAGEARTSRVIDAILTVGKMGKPAALPTALEVLRAGERKRGPGRPKKEAAPAGPGKKERNPLVTAYLKRADEIRKHVMVAPDGSIQVTPQSRQAIAAELAGVAAVAPLLADQLETQISRRLAFVADKLPRRPDIGMQVGPDTWRPSTFEIRAWARYYEASENPEGVEQRVADGTVSPEDAEAYRELYPERLAELTRNILQRLPELQRTLPERRKLALSILTGLPVHPALEPRILAVLQAQHGQEEGTEGGTMAPPAPMNMGSIKAEPMTPSQQRQA